MAALLAATPACNPFASSSADANFYPGVAYSLGLSTVYVERSQLSPGDATQVTVYLRDTAGKPFVSSLVKVAISADNPNAIGTFGDTVDNKDGTYSVTFTAEKPGSVPAVLVTLDGQALEGAAPTIIVTPGKTSASNAQVVVAAATVASATSVEVTLIAKDSRGNLMTSGGASVSFAASGGSSTGTFGPVTDPNDGTYHALFTGVRAGTPTRILGFVDGLPVTTPAPTLVVIPGMAALLAVSGGDNQIGSLRDQVAYALLATAFDVNGNPVAGVPLVWRVDDGDGNLINSGTSTDGNGTASSFWVLGSAPGRNDASARAGHLVARWTATGVANMPVAAHSSIVGTGPVVADGVGGSLVTVGMFDAMSEPVQGVTPIFVATDTNTTNAYGRCTATNANGIAFCTLTSRVAEIKALSLQSPFALAGGTVTFVPGPADPNTSALTLAPGGSVVADGNTHYAWALTLRDASNNVIRGYSASQVTLAAHGPGVLLTQAVGASDANGQFFGQVAATTAGTKTLYLEAPASLVPMAPLALTFTAWQGETLVFTAQPGGGTSLLPWAQQPRVQVQDGNGNLITVGPESRALVTLRIYSGTGMLLGVNQKAATLGIADFSTAGLAIDVAGTGKVLQASANLSQGLTQAVSTPFNVGPGAATALIFATQPGGAAGGQLLTPEPVVLVQDAAGNRVDAGPDSVVSVAMTLHAGLGTLGGTTTVTAIAGVAPFTDLTVDRVGPAKTLQAAATLAGGTATRTSQAFAVVPGAADHLVFATQPPATMVSQVAMVPQPKILIVDSVGNLVTGSPDATASVTLSLGQGAGSLLPMASLATQAVGGVADFGGEGLYVDLSGSNELLTAQKADMSMLGGAAALTVNSSPFAVLHGPATQVVFAAPPGGGAAGAVWAQQPVVLIQDAIGNAVDSGPDAGATVTLLLVSGDGTLLGTTSQAAVQGVATFTDLSMQVSGVKALVARKADTIAHAGTSTQQVLSPDFNIDAAGASRLAFVAQPSGGTAGVVWAQQPVLAVQDVYGNRVTSGADANALVTLTSGSNTAQLGGTSSLPAQDGLVTFTTLHIDTAGTLLRLQAAATLQSSPTALLSATFTVLPAAATQLVFVTEPGGGAAQAAWSQQPVLQLLDNFNNIVNVGADSNLQVTLNLSGGTGTLSGATTRRAWAGVADFSASGLRLDRTGTDKQLTAAATASGGPVAGLSSLFTIMPGGAAHLVFATQPGSGTAGVALPQQPVVQVQDAAGNLITTGADSNATVTLAPSSGTGSIVGLATATAAGGVATFAGLHVDAAGGGKSITASATLRSGAAAVGSTPFTVVHNSAQQLVYLVQPPTVVVALEPFVEQPVLAIADAYGNLVDSGVDADANVTVMLQQGTGQLQGALTVQAVAGIADFTVSDLTLDTVGNNKVLQAQKEDTQGAGGTAAIIANSITFAVKHGPATSIVVAIQPGGGTAAAVWGMQPQIQIVDAANNIVTSGIDATANISGALTAGSGTLSGISTVAAMGGVATFSGLSIERSGVKVLTFTKPDTANASSGGTRGSPTAIVASGAFSVVPAAATQLVFTSQPSGGVAGMVWAQQPAVQVQDTYGNLVSTGADASAAITLALTSGAGVLTGTTSIAALGGVATFSNLLLQTSGAADVLTASTTLASAAMPQAASAPFAIDPADAATLVFGTQPGGGVAGHIWAQQPVVQLRDAFGNLVNSGADSTLVVSLTLTTGTGALAGAATEMATGGIADFSSNGLAIDLRGSKVLTASIAGTLGTVTAASTPICYRAGERHAVGLCQPARRRNRWHGLGAAAGSRGARWARQSRDHRAR